MIRALVKVVLVVILLAAAAAFFMGYRWGGVTSRPAAEPAGSTTVVGTSGASDARERARAAGADIGDKIAVGAERASESIDEARVTAKVKSKVTLDDTLDGSRIQVSTDDDRVTLTGTVINESQHARALALARETEGVAAVVDHLSVGTR